MTLSLGIKLVILLPTFLFFVGFYFKSFVEKKSVKSLETTVLNGDIFLATVIIERFNDFFILLAIDSLFILIGNGLIIIFELGHNELGILTIILGMILSIYVFISVYSKNIITLGTLGIFGLLGGEFLYFLSYGIDSIPYNLSFETILVLGGIIGAAVGSLVIINTYNSSVKSISSLMEDKCKKCEKYEDCKVRLNEK